MAPLVPSAFDPGPSSGQTLAVLPAGCRAHLRPSPAVLWQAIGADPVGGPHPDRPGSAAASFEAAGPAPGPQPGRGRGTGIGTIGGPDTGIHRQVRSLERAITHLLQAAPPAGANCWVHYAFLSSITFPS
jgi:hypothetical protein